MSIKNNKLKTVQKNYNLEYWIGNKHIETIIYNLSKSLCTYTVNKLNKTNSYKLGEFKYIQII